MANHILRNKIPICSALVLFVVILSCGCEQERREVPAEAIPVEAVKVEVKHLKRTLDYAGNIKAQDEAIIYPRVSGKVIEKVRQEGEAVNRGDVLFYIDRDEVGFSFEKAPVESALSGLVGRVYVDKGSQVSGQTPVCLIVDIDRVKVELDIPERYLPLVSPGQTAHIRTDAYAQERFKGEVLNVSPVVDLATRTAPVEIVIDNQEHKLKPGMFARVQLIISEHKGAYVVPKEAVLGKDPDSYVYVIENNVARRRNIKLGLRHGPYYEARDGLKLGELAVIIGQQRLTDGATVTVEIRQAE